jgi:hypothetical protein
MGSIRIHGDERASANWLHGDAVRAPINEIARATTRRSPRSDWYLNRDWKLLAKFDGEFAKRSDVYAGMVALRYTW